jgi:hypothetical protein
MTLMHIKMDSSKFASIIFFKFKQMMLIIHKVGLLFFTAFSC